MSSTTDYAVYNPTRPLCDQLETVSIHKEELWSFPKYLSHHLVIKTYKPLQIGASTFTVSSKEEKTTEESQGDIFSTCANTYTVKNREDKYEKYENISPHDIDHVMGKIYKQALAKV